MNALQDICLRSLVILARLGSKRKALPVLIYHQVLSSPDSYRLMEPTLEQFSQQMDFVRDNFEVIDLSTAAQQLNHGELASDAIVITFDDGYRDNLYNAAQTLLDRGMVATFFIATGYLNDGRMWNDTLIDGFKHSKKLSIDLRELGLGYFKLDNDISRLGAARAIVNSVKYMQSDERERLVDRLAFELKADFDDVYMLTDGEIVRLDRMGMEVGAHTVSHPILLLESEERIASELRESKRYLESLIDKEVKSFAYPNGRYGKDYDEKIAKMVAEAGFSCAVSTEPGVSCVGDDVFNIRRFTPWSKNTFKFALQLIRNQYF